MVRTRQILQNSSHKLISSKETQFLILSRMFLNEFFETFEFPGEA